MEHLQLDALENASFSVDKNQGPFVCWLVHRIIGWSVSVSQSDEQLLAIYPVIKYKLGVKK